MAHAKGKLKSIARVLIQEKYVNGLSFRDLAAEANIKSSSVHEYFPQKAMARIKELIPCSEDYPMVAVWTS